MPDGYRPRLFRLREEAERLELTRLIEQQGALLQIFDTILLQLHDLIQSRHPARTLLPTEMDSLIREHLCGLSIDEYGTWVYYPWSRRIVHLLHEEEFVELRTNRNRYKITPAEQAELATKRIGIVGLSVGQSVAVVLALERSFGELRLADFDSLDLSNLNRIRAGAHSLGVSKVVVTAREIAEIDPFVNVIAFPEGITKNNLDAFLLEGGKLDVIVEECDSFDIKISVRHQARLHRIPVVMDTSDRGMLDIERFDLEPNRPIFHGLAGDLQEGALCGLTTEEKIPYVLQIIGSQTISSRLRSSMLEVGATLSTWPQLGSAVSSGGAVAADAARRIVLGQPVPSGRFFFDLENAYLSQSSERYVCRPEPSRPAVTYPDSLWHKLVSQAILAPSGGNAQPWQWLAGEDELRLFLDSSRSSGLLDFQNSGSFVALGCATENLVLATHAAGLEIRVQMFPPGDNPQHVASFSLLSGFQSAAEPHWRDELHEQITLRHTHRGLGRNRALTQDDLTCLTEAARSVDGASVQWVTNEQDLNELGRLVGAGDRLRILNQRMHRELFSELRWNAAEAESKRDGIDIEALELAPSDRAGLELCRDWSTLSLVHELHGGRNLEKLSQKQVRAAAVVGLVTMPGVAAGDFFRGGRALQRMWLAATERNISVHPMTALPYLFARLIRGTGDEFDQYTMEELHGLRARYQTLFQLTPLTGEVLLFRTGFADTIAKRSRRRPVEDVLVWC
jgi:molybdopterin/thiamine biosynthesis adenylyltransferase/nitroreductase